MNRDNCRNARSCDILETVIVTRDGVAENDSAHNTNGSLRFDFNKAVEDARRDFPEQSRNVTFINLDAPDAEEQMQKVFDSLNEEDRKTWKHHQYHDTNFMTKDAMPAVWHHSGGAVLLAYGSRAQFSEVEKIAYNPNQNAKSLFYTFWHEFGHIVVPGAQQPNNKAEHAADSFAMLRGLQSNFLTRNDIKQIADGRDMLCWLNADVTHITGMSLDALLINPKHTDFLSLSPLETATIAAKHAETFSLNADMSSYTRIAYKTPKYDWTMTTDEIRQQRLVGMGEIVLSADNNSLAYYFAARVLLTAQAKKEAGDPNAEKADFSHQWWKRVFDNIAKQVRKRDIGASKAVENNAGAETMPEAQNLVQKLKTRLKPLSI